MESFKEFREKIYDTFFSKKGRLCCFFFLPLDISAILSSIIIAGVCVLTHYLNIMINEEISTSLKTAGFIFAVVFLISLLVFIIGILMKKLILIQQLATGSAIYIFFSLACFCCSFATLLISYTFKDEYNLIIVYKDYYIDDHPDTELEEDEIISIMKKTFYLKSLAHIVLIGIMMYYYSVMNDYIKEKEYEVLGDFDHKFFSNGNNVHNSNSKAFGSNSNFGISNTNIKGSSNSVSGTFKNSYNNTMFKKSNNSYY